VKVTATIATRELLQVAEVAALAGAEVASAWARRRSELEIEEKAAPDDLVSQADRDAERAIRRSIAELRPDDGVLGEEGGAAAGSSGICWLIDPIDGTTNYLYGRPDWAVSVAAVLEEERQTLAAVVAEPAAGKVTVAIRGGGAWSDGRLRCRAAGGLPRSLVEVNWGSIAQRAKAAELIAALGPRVRDIRRGGSAAAGLAQVADGRADAYWGPGLQPWDGAAGALIAREAGAVVGDLDGETDGDWPPSGNVLAAPRALWDPLREILQRVYVEEWHEGIRTRPRIGRTAEGAGEARRVVTKTPGTSP
jgi:myo-inositol-1(or 4)-monophosphatase